ncbi:MAG: hypothetical protein ACFFFG_01490 [Candidatus Thorarchaeota archaeon]
MKDPERDEIVKSFFQTHTGELAYVPGVTPDQLPAKIKDILPSLVESDIAIKLLQIDGLKEDKTSKFALIDCLFNFRCDVCNGVPVIFEGAAFSKNGMTYFTEDGQEASIPTTGQISAVQEGYHFLLNGYCAQCDRSRYVIASHHPEIVPLINTFATEALGLIHPDTTGFIALPSWIDTYFSKKEFDKKFAQRTVIRLTTTLFTLGKATASRRLPGNLKDQETAEGVKNDLQMLLPEIKDELEFCGFVKGVFHFQMIYVLFRRNLIQALESKHPHLKIQQVIAQAKKHASSLAPGKKAECFVIGLLLIAETYRTLTNSMLPLPHWVRPYCEGPLKQYFRKGDLPFK